MADVILKSIKFPGLPDTYLIPQGGGDVEDVQIGGTSIVSEGVANIPYAGESSAGVVKATQSVGIYTNANGFLVIKGAVSGDIKAGTEAYKPITPATQGNSAFYGMATAAGDTTQKSSSNAVGTYTENAKSAISSMLSAPETVSGTTPVIVANAGIQYVCGEVSTIDITPSATGVCDVVFRSGSTPAVLTMPNTVIFPSWFDPTSLEADTYYEINVLNGTMGTVALWA